MSANCLRLADFPTRLRVAAATGFDGIGLRLDDYRSARASGFTDADLRSMLADIGLRVLEVEHTWDWVAPTVGPGRRRDEVATEVLRAATALGSRQLNLVLFFEHDLDDVVDAFGRLSDRAADAGVLVGLEFLPYSHVRTVADAWTVVARADRPNAGVMIDAWHYFRSAGSAADLTVVPAARITSLQLNDVGPVAASDLDGLREEARHHRLLPGTGSGDLDGLLDTLRAMGVAAPVSVEVFSDWLDAQPAAEAARLVFDAAHRTLERAGWR